MLIRVFLNTKGEVLYNKPGWQTKVVVDEVTKESKTIKCLANINECKIPKEYEGFPYFIADESELPYFAPCSSEYYQIHVEGEFKKENIKKDTTWQKCLMPTAIIKEKHCNDILHKMKTASLEDFQKLYVEMETCKKSDDEAFWIEKAIECLSRAEVDKSVVKQKLEEKLEVLKNAKK